MEGRLVKLGKDDYILHVNNKPFAYKKLSLKNCQTIENGYDLDELAEKHYDVHIKRGHTKEDSLQRKIDFILGFQKAIEILGDKKFSEEDVKFMFQLGFNLDKPISKNEYDVHIQSLQQTEWDVEIEMEQDYLKWKQSDIEDIKDCLVPKLDEDGCLILKRK